MSSDSHGVALRGFFSFIFIFLLSMKTAFFPICFLPCCLLSVIFDYWNKFLIIHFAKNPDLFWDSVKISISSVCFQMIMIACCCNPHFCFFHACFLRIKLWIFFEDLRVQLLDERSNMNQSPILNQNIERNELLILYQRTFRNMFSWWSIFEI
jgi:hypothetical protein